MYQHVTSYGGGPSPIEQLNKYSLTGQSARLRRQMLVDKFVLNKIAILGQWTTIYGAPNSGKTLLTKWLLREALLSDEIDGESVYYINADDNYRGLVDKIELAEAWGMHVIAPHHNGFDIAQIAALMSEMGQGGTARGAVFILDTLKKFTDLMDKRAASEFGQVARGFVSAGGTLIALAHTNKHPDAEGKRVYSGTSDIVDDSDCCFVIVRTVSRIRRSTKAEVQAAYKSLNAVTRNLDTLQSMAGFLRDGTGLHPDLPPVLRASVHSVRSAGLAGLTDHLAVADDLDRDVGDAHHAVAETKATLVRVNSAARVALSKQVEKTYRRWADAPGLDADDRRRDYRGRAAG